jgi:hypothetical protein
MTPLNKASHPIDQHTSPSSAPNTKLPTIGSPLPPIPPHLIRHEIQRIIEELVCVLLLCRPELLVHGLELVDERTGCDCSLVGRVGRDVDEQAPEGAE